MHKSFVVALCVVVLAACRQAPSVPPAPPDLSPLTAESASNFAQITLRCVAKAYPSQPGYVLNAPEDVQLPDAVHPAFYGCYDWHSSVHGHWMLARLLRLVPTLPEAAAIIAALDRNLSAENLVVEAAYFAKPGTAAFDGPTGGPGRSSSPRNCTGRRRRRRSAGSSTCSR